MTLGEKLRGATFTSIGIADHATTTLAMGQRCPTCPALNGVQHAAVAPCRSASAPQGQHRRHFLRHRPEKRKMLGGAVAQDADHQQAQQRATRVQR